MFRAHQPFFGFSVALFLGTSTGVKALPTQDEVKACIKRGDANPDTVLQSLQYLHREQWGGSCYAFAGATVYEKQIEPPVRSEKEKFSPECAAFLYKIEKTHALESLEGMNRLTGGLTEPDSTVVDSDIDFQFIEWIRKQESLPSEADCSTKQINIIQKSLAEFRQGSDPFKNQVRVLNFFTKQLKRSATTDKTKIVAQRTFVPKTFFDSKKPKTFRCPDTEKLALTFACMQIPVAVNYFSSAGVTVKTEAPYITGDRVGPTTNHSAVLIGMDAAYSVEPTRQMTFQDSKISGSGIVYDFRAGRALSVMPATQSCRIMRISAVFNAESKRLYDAMNVDVNFKKSLYKKTDYAVDVSAPKSQHVESH